jgi:hypothetical protein
MTNDDLVTHDVCYRHVHEYHESQDAHHVIQDAVNQPHEIQLDNASRLSDDKNLHGKDCTKQREALH